jgi:hypothetical protein
VLVFYSVELVGSESFIRYGMWNCDTVDGDVAIFQWLSSGYDLSTSSDTCTSSADISAIVCSTPAVDDTDFGPPCAR